MGTALLAAESAVGTSVLTGEVLTQIQQGFADMSATVTQVAGIAVVAAVGVIGLTVGINYALKKIKGVMSKAS